ncbi:hypothetical protein FYK55_24280 [Roseiconus nitratireducens]|uniref:Methyltransferase family protein n=1 Tax=Roseiconus nitratireducens TaxID=2605748 RepID=A0A5M6CW50_9BACT|nr:hypothetical protein [Roseiconus nitratireducens]KAA5539454.1 hypothetical protein FYK55_24280 [Roseiconus nitratireducens]
MNRSAETWLRARELADTRSRNELLARQFCQHLRPDTTVIDLGCGGAANLRYLSRFLRVEQPCLGIDHDPDILACAAEHLRTPSVQFRRLDLARHLSHLPRGPQTAFTASAFLDLASQDFLIRFVELARETPLLIAMTASGTPRWDPVETEFETTAIDEFLSAHRRSDHGFGPSVGYDAADRLSELLSAAGCSVTTVQTDWNLDFRDATLIRLLIDGIANRLASLKCDLDINRWRERRLQLLADAVLVCTVPHRDLLSIPPGRGGTEQ